MSRLTVLNNQQRIPIFELGITHHMRPSGTPQQTPAVSASTHMVCLTSRSPARIAIGDDPTATATSFYLPSRKVIPLLMIEPGQKVSVRSNGSNTIDVYVTEML